MNSNVIALYTGGTPAVREIDDQDLFVRMVETHPGHIQRRADKKAKRLRAIRKAQEDRDQQMRDLAMFSQLMTTFVVVTLGLAL